MSKVVFLLEEGNNGVDGLRRLLVENTDNGWSVVGGGQQWRRGLKRIVGGKHQQWLGEKHQQWLGGKH